MAGPLAGIKVLDLTQGFAGPFGVKQLADQGADVLKIERPGGDPMRHAGPFPGDEAHPEKGGLFLYLNTGRRGIVLGLKDAADLERMRALVALCGMREQVRRRWNIARGLEARTVRAYSERWGEAITAILVATPGSRPPDAELEALCRADLAAYKIPKRFVFIDAMPMTTTGKIRKIELREIASA